MALVENNNADILISQFCEITGADVAQAQNYLSIYNFDIAQSVAQYLEVQLGEEQNQNQPQVFDTYQPNRQQFQHLLGDTLQGSSNKSRNYKIDYEDLQFSDDENLSDEEYNPESEYNEQINKSKIYNQGMSQGRRARRSKKKSNPVDIAGQDLQQINIQESQTDLQQADQQQLQQQSENQQKDVDIIQIDDNDNDNDQEGQSIDDLVQQQKYGSWKSSSPLETYMTDQNINQASNPVRKSNQRRQNRRSQRQNRRQRLNLNELDDEDDIETEIPTRRNPSRAKTGDIIIESSQEGELSQHDSDNDVQVQGEGQVQEEGDISSRTRSHFNQELFGQINRNQQNRSRVENDLNEYVQRVIGEFGHSELFNQRFPAQFEGAQNQQSQGDNLQNNEMREIRDFQQEQYNKSLEADRRKRQEKITKELQQQQENQLKEQLEIEELINTKNLLDIKKQRLPSEPSQNEPNTLLIMIKLKDGQRVKRRFNKSDQIQNLFDYIDTSQFQDIQQEQYKLIKQFPRQTFLNNDQRTLQEAGLQNNEALYMDV